MSFLVRYAWQTTFFFTSSISCFFPPVDREPAGSAEGQRETTGRLERPSQVVTDGHLQYRHGAGNAGGGSG